MTETELREGIAVLDRLSQQEYKESLQQLTRNDDGQRLYNQVGRLVGVILKEPFAHPTELPAPSAYTHAYRSWDLVDEKTFEARQKTEGAPLNALLKELKQQGEVADDLTLYQMAQYAHHERGYFGFLAKAFHKYICNDPKFRQEIEATVEKTKKAGVDVKYMTPEAIVGAGGLSLGVWLVGAFPPLGVMGAPVIAGIVLVIYRIGVDAFCSYSDSSYGDAENK